MPDFKFFFQVELVLLHFFRYAWGTSDRKKWGTLDTLPQVSLNKVKLEGLYWNAVQNNSNL